MDLETFKPAKLVDDDQLEDRLQRPLTGAGDLVIIGSRGLSIGSKSIRTQLTPTRLNQGIILWIPT